MIEPSLQKFWFNIGSRDSCWKWIGTTLPNGYGYFYKTRKIIYAHRFSFEQFKGKILKGLEIDHLCKNRACVNPDHLEAVTPQENMRRVDLKNNGEWQRKKTHCPKGHLLSGSNLDQYEIKRGWRICKICRNERKRKTYQKIKREKSS